MQRFTILLALSILPVMGASSEICRSVSASWEEAGSINRTVMWTTATNGCKDIEHQTATTYDQIYAYRPGIEASGVTAVRGVDCNCDLIADGEEGNFSAPPGLNGDKLIEICQGPIAPTPEAHDGL